jgi:hypothetical protein
VVAHSFFQAYNGTMKKEEQSDNLNEAQEAKIALQELADLTTDEFIKKHKLKRRKSNTCEEEKSKK